MLAPGDLLTSPPPDDPNRGAPHSPPGEGRAQSAAPRAEPPDPRPTFLEALRRMLASIHS